MRLSLWIAPRRTFLALLVALLTTLSPALIGLSASAAPAPACNPTTLSGGNIGVGEVALQFTHAGCSWSVPTGVSDVHVLIVAGGGGGGASCVGGGGGGGGVIDAQHVTVSGAVFVGVGFGGAGGSGPCQGSTGSSGGNSRFDTLTAMGGGGGGSFHVVPDGVAGGSGGGGSGGVNSGGWLPGLGGAGTPGQGFAGGDGMDQTVGPGSPGGGGGGAGEAGHTSITVTGGNGGSGYSSVISGAATYYAAGGGGASDHSFSPGIGGSGCGGNGGSGNSTNPADTSLYPETAPTLPAGYGCGGGGATGTTYANGTSGSPGIVIVRYSVTSATPTPTPTPTPSTSATAFISATPGAADAGLASTGQAQKWGLGAAAVASIAVGILLAGLSPSRRLSSAQRRG